MRICHDKIKTEKVVIGSEVVEFVDGYGFVDEEVGQRLIEDHLGFYEVPEPKEKEPPKDEKLKVNRTPK